MKTLEIKLEDSVFHETEQVAQKLGIPVTEYVLDAIARANHNHNREFLEAQLVAESKLTRSDSLNMLQEFGL